jgi:hypothetical protein
MSSRKAVLVFVAVLAASLAWAETPPAYSVEDPSGVALTSTMLAGQRFLLWYEGPRTVSLNDDAKRALDRVLPRTGVRLVAVGDVSAYDYWPARAFAKRKLTQYAAKYGHPIFGDWHAQMRAAFHLQADVSNLLFVDANGAVLFRATGKLSQEQVDRVVALLGNGS